LGLRKLSKITNQLVNLDQILHQNETLELIQIKENIHKQIKQDIACIYGYSSTPKNCDLIVDIAAFFFNPLGAILRASKGPKYAENKTTQTCNCQYPGTRGN
jgi:hypothetical protein